MLDTLHNEYGMGVDMVEAIRHTFADTRGQVAGDNQFFATTMGVKQGCPMSPLLFGPFFDRLAAFITEQVGADNLLRVATLTIAAALYADDVALLAPHPTALQLQLDAMDSFCLQESLRISGNKTLAMQVNCS